MKISKQKFLRSLFFSTTGLSLITFDLKHINQGWDDERHDYANRNRSSYTASDIVDFFEQFKYFKVEWQLGLNKETITIKGTLYYRYYWETTDEYGILVRVILDVPERETGEGIIVTVFRP